MKRQANDLALLGGSRAFAEPLHVGRPNIGDRENLLRRVNDLLDRRWLTNNGPYVQEFEKAIADHLSVRHCIAVCNATVALEIAIRAMDLKGEVIVPSFTFVATAHALQWQEIRPVFCDIDPLTHTIDAGKIEELITPRTSGILGVHLWGRPCDVAALERISEQHGLKLLFDSAHAFGCSAGGTMIGGFGDAEVLSFHATKFLNSFEGGAVVTNDGVLAAKIRLMKNFGFADFDQVDYVGTNGKMTEVCAAMGLTSLEAIDDIVRINQRNYAMYQEQLAHVPGVSLVLYDEQERNNYQYVVLELDSIITGLSRDALQAILHAENVLARRYFYPGCHEMEPYRSCYPSDRDRLPVTESVASRVLTLPTGTAVGPDEVAQICEIIRLAATTGPIVMASLANGHVDLKAHDVP